MKSQGEKQRDEISACGSDLGWGRLTGCLAQREDKRRQEN